MDREKKRQREWCRQEIIVKLHSPHISIHRQMFQCSVAYLHPYWLPSLQKRREKMNRHMVVRYGICFYLLTSELGRYFTVLQYTFMRNTASTVYSGTVF